ncbi:N-acetyltransferase [Rubrobacter xylanophilus]|uniref:N-acetyltransferase n=1 Tax=Rubrobacter xylanophilus TaxID=49319 RepID=A0A510HFN8_9ACTN|nr:GNAT family protein [Rubrobacter xylanophilus]BBL78770.1 N-acetyltransferase [Rubrobacter xylanophilus]
MRLGGAGRRLSEENVELRRHQRRNYALYGRWYADPEIWHLTSWSPSPPAPDSVRRLFEERENSRTEESFAIHPRGDPEPIGVISLINISHSNASADLSVIVAPRSMRHRGYGSAAIRALLRYAFEELGLNRVGLSVFEFNAAAIATYEKLGFREEGRLRRAVRRDGRFYDAILMSILKKEWEARED